MAWELVIASVVTLACAIVSGVLGRMVIRHRRELREIERVAQAAAEGGWTSHCRLSHPAADAFNRLMDQTRRRVQHLTRRSGDLQALVDALPDVILLADTRGKVILINNPAARLLRIDEQQALGSPLTNVVNDRAVLEVFDLFERTRRSEPLVKALRLTREGLKISFHAVGVRTEAGGVLLVLRDVTQLAATVQMKTDFVANASHELRTPISAIKVAFETLREVAGEDPKQMLKCLDIVDGHMRRLEEMLRDLLDLSRVEQQDLKPSFAPTPVREVAFAVQSALASMAKQKKVSLDLFDPAGPEHIITDRRLLDIALKNLVENSVKYTAAGGAVRMRFLPHNGELRAIVADNGIGIPREHLDRVFERFYQVDAARSGIAGRGTGLGLAIVKHAVNALGGTIKIDSELGEGTTVTLHLPQPAENAVEARAAGLA